MSMRITNNPETGSTVTKIQYVDRVVTTPAPEPIIQYVTHTITQEVQVDRIVEKLVVTSSPDFTSNINNHEVRLIDLEEKTKSNLSVSRQQYEVQKSLQSDLNKMGNELEMQRRDLIGLKQQRDIDRSRRLMLIKRMKKEHEEQKATDRKLKIAIAVAALLPLLLLIIKL